MAGSTPRLFGGSQIQVASPPKPTRSIDN